MGCSGTRSLSDKATELSFVLQNLLHTTKTDRLIPRRAVTDETSRHLEVDYFLCDKWALSTSTSSFYRSPLRLDIVRDLLLDESFRREEPTSP